jgi:hypothetical protein
MLILFLMCLDADLCIVASILSGVCKLSVMRIKAKC